MKCSNLKQFFTGIILVTGLILGFAPCAEAQSKTKKTTAKPTVTTAPNKTVAATPTPAGLSAMGITDIFFKKYKEEGTEQAIDYLFSTNKLFTDTAQISGLKKKLIILKQSVGQYLGKELIAQKNAGKNLYFYSYVLRFENQPVRFTFMFYKPKNDWVLYHFKFDADLDNELEQAGKIK